MATAPEDARRGAEIVEDAAETVHEHPVFENVARGGFVMSGAVHVLIGWIALRIALGGTAQDADQSGALATIAAAPGGNLLLWIGGAAMCALALWHLAEAWFGAKWKHGTRERVTHAVKTLGKAVVYAALAQTALRFAAGASSDSSQQTQELTSGLMSSMPGRAAVVVAGLVVGAYHLRKGLTRGFEDDLRPTGDQRIGTAVIVTGVVGYIAKGLALVSVGLIFGWAAIGADPEKATGLDGALKTMVALPAGTILLAVVGGGLILYGIYSMLRSRYAPM